MVLAHVEGTTGSDGKARREFEYQDLCSQCGRIYLAPTNRVAAHVVRYPWWCCGLCGTEELITTCKRCNNSSHPNGRVYTPVSGSIRGPTLRRLWCRPVCVPVVHPVRKVMIREIAVETRTFEPTPEEASLSYDRETPQPQPGGEP